MIQSLLTGVLGCQLPLSLPSFVIKYLRKTFNSWHIVLELLQDSLKHLWDKETVRDAALDALAEHSAMTIGSMACGNAVLYMWFLGLDNPVAHQEVESQDIPLVGKELTFWFGQIYQLECINLLNLKLKLNEEIARNMYLYQETM